MRSTASPAPAPAASQTPSVSAATPSTAGTKYVATRSASRRDRRLAPCASSTARAIRASAVAAPPRHARTASAPWWFSVPAYTGAPSALSTGRLSPVSIDSSTAERPSITVPSAASRSPGRTSITSPGANAAASTSLTPPRPLAAPPRRRRRQRDQPAHRVREPRRARASRSLPTITNATIAAPASK